MPIRPKTPRFAEGQEEGHWGYSNGTDSEALIDSLFPPTFGHFKISFFRGVGGGVGCSGGFQ